MLERLTPVRFLEHVEDVTVGLLAGYFREPRFEYAPLPTGFSRTISEIEAIRVGLSGLRLDPRWDLLRELLDERAEELILEARLVVLLGSSEFISHARRRFLLEPEFMTAAEQLAQSWLLSNEELGTDGDQVRLVSYFVERARQAGYSFRIIERPIASIAAASRDGLIVQTSALVSQAEADRIWTHEVGAHLLPRLAGDHSLGPMVVGTRGAGEDEEGRALLEEKRQGQLKGTRKRTLAVRHLIASAILNKSQTELGESALRLVETGIQPRLVARAVCRSLRGGGLSRELAYLPALLRVQACLAHNPELEWWMKWGRVSAAASVRLDQWLESNSMTHGA